MFCVMTLCIEVIGCMGCGGGVCPCVAGLPWVAMFWLWSCMFSRGTCPLLMGWCSIVTVVLLLRLVIVRVHNESLRMILTMPFESQFWMVIKWKNKRQAKKSFLFYFFCCCVLLRLLCFWPRLYRFCIFTESLVLRERFVLCIVSTWPLQVGSYRGGIV